MSGSNERSRSPVEFICQPIDTKRIKVEPPELYHSHTLAVDSQEIKFEFRKFETVNAENPLDFNDRATPVLSNISSEHDTAVKQEDILLKDKFQSEYTVLNTEQFSQLSDTSYIKQSDLSAVLQNMTPCQETDKEQQIQNEENEGIHTIKYSESDTYLCQNECDPVLKKKTKKSRRACKRRKKIEKNQRDVTNFDNEMSKSDNCGGLILRNFPDHLNVNREFINEHFKLETSIDNTMTSQNCIGDAEIARLLAEKSDQETEGSDSEIENKLIEDDVQSDIEDMEEGPPLLDNPPNAENVPERHENFTVFETSAIVMPQSQSLRGKNGHSWTATKGLTGCRESVSKIINTPRGPTRINRSLCDPLECFSIFLTEEIVEEITKWTNIEIQVKTQRPNVKATFKTTTVCEIRALIGILTLTAAMKDNHLSTEEIFDCSYSGNRYVATMSRDRFDFLITCLRMDDKSLRPGLRTVDIFIPIRKVWEIFVNNCRSNYTPGPYVTIDEQLVCFRGRCPFRIYIPNKLNKCGIKMVMTCDAVTRYMIDAMPYLGECTQTNGLPLGEFYVKELTKAIHGSNRNVTCDNWFTSVPLAKDLLREPYNLTMVGTIRSNKREIPEELKAMRYRRVGSSMFCYDGPLTLVSYKPKPNKMMFVLSSCDEEGTVNPSTSKPDMINFYNETKGGVNTFDQMCSSMSCRRKTNRWPMAIFYAMLNMAFINSYIIYCHNIAYKHEKPLSRRSFMKKLSDSLITPWMMKRQEIPTLSTSLKGKISSIAPKRSAESLSQEDDIVVPKKRKYCAFCPSKIRRMTKSVCDTCNISICGEHKLTTCPNCL